MPVLSTGSSSLCLFCTVATHISSRRLLPLVHTARRTTTSRPFRKVGLNPIRDSQRVLRSLNDPEKIKSVILARLDLLRRQLEDKQNLEDLRLSRAEFSSQWSIFKRYINLWIKRGSSEATKLAQDAARGRSNLDQRLKYLFYAQTVGSHFTQAELENQKELADLRYPGEWYPATREYPRTVHLHVGPTNSGKTYHALKRLEQAETGIYLGPLRLLAHEVYTRLNAKGKPCALVTGEEQRMPEANPTMWSCTVEMAPLNQALDVAVIDEIQMINHEERGWAWTQAFLGVQAREVHLCGEARAVPLIRELCALIGDKVQVHRYERLSPLKVADRSLYGKLYLLEKGDCVVAFSILAIHALRREIEMKTGRKCAIVYGSLPPETRAQQARLFNDPNNEYDFLVASDAVGMGLNLSIKRVIFEATSKNNGTVYAPLKVSEIKQIAGRAGRYRTAEQDIGEDTQQNDDTAPVGDSTVGLDDKKPDTGVQHSKQQNPSVGYVTTLDQMDFNYLRMCMEREPEPIKTAGLFPPSLIVERFANYFPPGTPFSYILLRLHEITNIDKRFHLCALKDQLKIADTIQPVKNLSIQERLMICSAPINCKDEEEKDFLRALASCIAENQSGDLLGLPHLPLELLDDPPSGSREYLQSLESLHKLLVLYLWLSYRFENVFTTRALANHVKKMVEDKIEHVLSQFSFTQEAREAMRRKRQEALLQHLEESEEGAAETLARKKARGQDLGASGASVSKRNDMVDIPPPMEDIIHDKDLGSREDVSVDDVDEYPTPELEALEPSMAELHHQHRRHHPLTPIHSSEGDSESVPELDEVHKSHQERSPKLSEQTEDVKGGRMPTSVSLNASHTDTTQPRI
ncbi:P-loop containing nucleoside triphosphate hydrolase protein [Lindgomyces ingoldianus]|uniref:P-loop containing nucleoside triphosphate hydrolase protein n=1 Tax=Lindgomyces ingoldianus TaxID=673940 RepID=A0ACB6R452_9PLEO|nr:P-loop containing nucleoside triphosphate hydrolase protein [Lindgomyces ingoldianus]KAF2473921.1 P-loop containing nucleoside triphosphate hydrolase protein [Lindgomyces ingoldianus]